MPVSTSPAPGRFHAERPTDLRRPPRWHRFAYIGRHLPAVLDAMAPDLQVGPGGRVLDHGCADAPYRSFFASGVDYVGADLPGNPVADVEIGPDGRLPLDDASFDAVLSTQVLEHVEDPGMHLAESFRVLRPGGRMLLSTHGIMVLHPDPVDLWRWTCDGLERIVGEAGFEVERFEGIMGPVATGLFLQQEGILPRLPAVLHPPLALVFQTMIAIADRLDSDAARRQNALVFALVARRPE